MAAIISECTKDKGLIEALEKALAVHGDGYSWGPQARAALRAAKGG